MARPHDDEYVAFVEATLDGLRRTGYLVCGDWHRAEDAVQEALIRLYRHWDTVERREGRVAWARRTTVRLLVDESRRPWRRERAVEHLPDTGTADPTTGVDERDALVRALLALSPGQRSCVVLRFYEELSVAETAAVLGRAEGTVKSQTADALARLRTLLTDEPGYETETQTAHQTADHPADPTVRRRP